jgi:hypothetical protein
LGKGIGSSGYDLVQFLKRLRDASHFLPLSNLRADFVTALSPTFRDFVPSVVDLAVAPPLTSPAARLAFLAKNARHIPTGKFGEVGKFINAALSVAPADEDVCTEALKAYASVCSCCPADATAKIMLQAVSAAVPKLSVCVGLFCSSPPARDFTAALLSFALSPYPKHPDFLAACAGAQAELAGVLGSGSMQEAVAAHLLLSCAARREGGELGPELGDAELDVIASRVGKAFGTSGRYELEEVRFEFPPPSSSSFRQH